VEDLEADFRAVEEQLEVGFDRVEVGGGDRAWCPEERVVVGEEAEEET
jgi:hypothetical protein